MRILSTAFENDTEIPEKYSAERENVNPPLTFSEVPKDAISLVLIVEDPDAPMGNFIHWVLYNMPASTLQILPGQTPAGALVGKNSMGKEEYMGPQPPSGTHRYIFKLYALERDLNLKGGASKDEVEKAMKNNIIDQAELIGLYSKK